MKCQRMGVGGKSEGTEDKEDELGEEEERREA